MTIREFYQEIINVLQVQQMEGRNDADLYSNTADCNVLMDKALALIDALDARNEKRKNTETKEKKETAERRAAVLAFLKEQTEPVTRDTIAGVLDMEPAKVSGACKGLVDAGLVTKSEVKVEKARKIAYSAVK
jgi:DNA-binding MarR family transcriptional regulator